MRILTPFWYFGLTAWQLLVTIITLGIVIDLVTNFDSVTGWNYTLFVAVFSLLCFGYMLVSMSCMPRIYHRMAFLALFGLLWIFWLVAWARNASYTSEYNKAGPLTGLAKNIRGRQRALLAFTLIEWFLLIATFAYFGLVLFKHTRHGGPDLVQGGGMSHGASPAGAPGAGFGAGLFSRRRAGNVDDLDHEKGVDEIHGQPVIPMHDHPGSSVTSPSPAHHAAGGAPMGHHAPYPSDTNNMYPDPHSSQP